MGDKKCSVAISGAVKKKLDDYCFKVGVKLQHVVDKAVLEEISKQVSEDDIEVAKLLREAKADVYGLNEVKQVMSSVNFYDGYSDSNLKAVLEKMPNADEEYVALLTRVYALGKNKTVGVKEKLKKAVEILERTNPETEPKQLGHPPESAKPLVHKPKGNQKFARMKAFHLTEQQYDTLEQVAKEWGVTWWEAYTEYFGNR